MTKKKPERVISYRVSCQGYEEQLVMLTDPPKDERDRTVLAIQKAAERWGVRWGKIVHDCTAVLFGDQLRCFCEKCKQTFLSDTSADRCPKCLAVQQQAARDFFRRQSRSQDRRIGAKN